MLNRFMDSDGDYDGVDQPRRQPFQWKWYHPLIAVAVLFPYISIFALFGVVSNQKTSNHYYTAPVVASTFSTGSVAASTLSAGEAVSFTSTGQIQAGAGTSIYMDLATLAANCPAYPTMVAINSNTYLLAYADKATEKSTLQLVQVTETASGVSAKVIYSVTDVNYYIYELALLPGDDAVFVAICQDVSTNDETAYVLAGKVNIAAPTITLTNSPVQYADMYTVTPSIEALSETGFVIAYYNYSPQKLAVAYGQLDLSTLAITLSTPLLYADNFAYSYYFDIAPLTTTSFLLMVYNITAPASTSGSGPLQAAVAVVDPSAAANVITLGAFSTLASSQLSYFFTSVALDASTVVVAYANAAEDFALTCQVVQLLNQTGSTGINTPVVFGSSWTVNSGHVFSGNLSTGLSDIDISVVSTAGEFIVAYPDYSNNGVLTASMGQVSASGSIQRISPDFLLSPAGGNNNLNTVYTWSAMAASSTDYLDSQLAIATFSTTSDCSVLATSSFNVLQRLPSAVGIVSATTKSTNTVSVTLNGLVESVYSQLTPGKVYYANTRGKLIAAAGYAGRNLGYCVMTASDPNSQDPSVVYGSQQCADYLYDAATKTIVTYDSIVGLAVSTTSLNLATTSSWQN